MSRNSGVLNAVSFSDLRVSRLGISCALAYAMFFCAPLFAQDKEKDKDKAAETAIAAAKEESSVTEHSVRIGGQTIPYKATASTTLLKNEKDEPVALIFSVAYIRSDVKDASQRPISFVYNGGPGSASLWLDIGAFGPRRVETPNAESAPPPPYKLED